MKIGILTLHYAHNYGATLQAYALCSYLKSNGHDVRIVDYRLPYIYEQYLPLDFNYFYHRFQERNNRPLAFFKALNYYRTHRHRNAQWYRFQYFINKVLPRTKRIFHPKQTNSLKLDAIVCGSDQIWNERLTDGFKGIYFCEDISEQPLKIAYAASAGSCLMDQASKQKFGQLLRNFDTISAREQDLDNLLKSLGVQSRVVLDPVFMLRKSDWKILISDKPLVSGEYVLTYSFNENHNFFDEVVAFSKQINLPLVSIVFSKDDKLPKEIIQVTDAGPLEFLNYFYHASFVITNSFHGTAFSVLFEKQFFCVPPRKGRERTDSLLALTGLESRIREECFTANEVIDYNIVRPKLEEQRRWSGDFLSQSLTRMNITTT